MRALSSIALASAIAVAATNAHAADDVRPFGDRAHNVLVLDNLVGFVHVARVFSGLGGDAFSGNYYGFAGVPPIARFGYHRIFDGRITFGLGLHYADQSYPAGQLSQAPIRTWGLSPRVGFIVPFDPRFALWLRGGLTYLNENQPGVPSTDTPGQNTPDQTEWHLAIGGEAQLVFTPLDHVGVTLGPTIEWGIAGALDVGGQSESVRWRLYGLTLGLLVDF